MTNEFNSLMNRLDEYEKEFYELWDQYDPDDSYLKIELLSLKMSALFHKSLIDCYDILNEDMIDYYLNKLKKFLTIVTFISSCATIPTCYKNAPGFTIAACLSSTYLSIKRTREARNSLKLSFEEQQMIEHRLIKIENDFVDITDIVNDRTIDFEDESELEQLEEPERKERLICTKLVHAIKDNKKIIINEDSEKEVIKNIIQNSLDEEKNDLKELIKDARNEYDKLSSSVIKLYRKKNKARHLFNVLYI